MRLSRLAAVPKNRLAMLVGRYFAPAALVEGLGKDSDQELRLLDVGEPRFKEYLSNLVFQNTPRTVRAFRAYLPKLGAIFATTSFDLGVALIPNAYEPSLRGVYSYRATKNVRQETDISAPWEQLVRSWQNYSETGRRIRKARLQHRISREARDFDFFYHRMFLPHVGKQYGELAYVDTYDEMKPWFDRGLLVLVEEAGKTVAGGLCAIVGDTLVFYRTGVLEGDHELVKKGAQAAIYSFMLSFAKEQKLKSVNFLMSHAFVHNGVYKHKAGWGAKASPDDKAAQSLLYFLPKGNANTSFFLEKNPIIVNGEGGTLDVVTGWNRSAEGFTAAKDQILRACAAPGIRRVFVHSARGAEILPCDALHSP